MHLLLSILTAFRIATNRKMTHSAVVMRQCKKIRKDINMENISEQKAMDMILKYLIDNIGKPILSYDICEKIFHNADKYLVYSYIKRIIEENNDIVIVHKDGLDLCFDSFYCYLEATKLTDIFLNTNGGFEKLYEKRQLIENEQLRIKKIQEKKLEDDAKLSKWQVRTFWWFFGFSLVSFCYGIYDIITDLKSDKYLDKIELSNQQLESELSKLRTLVLDQKTVDSLHISKNHVDSLNKK